MMQVRTEKKPTAIDRFSSGLRPRVHGRPAVGAIVLLVAFVGSLLAATLGPVAGDLLPFPLLLLLTLIRG
jgi:hypothetical protein